MRQTGSRDKEGMAKRGGRLDRWREMEQICGTKWGQTGRRGNGLRIDREDRQKGKKRQRGGRDQMWANRCGISQKKSLGRAVIRK